MIKLNFKEAFLILIGRHTITLSNEKPEDVDTDSELSNNKKISVWIPILIAIGICIFLWIGGMFLTHWYAGTYFDVEGTDNKQALFGDSFGAVNALIAAFAFAGVIVSMYLQRKDLELQRKSLKVQQEELKQNTRELALQRQEFQVQNKTMKLQRFENTFFNMLTLLQEIVSNLSYNYTLGPGGESINVKSRDTFRIMFNDAYIGSKKYLTSDTKMGDDKNASGIRYYIRINGLESYNRVSDKSIFNHYFRFVYRIIAFVDQTYLLETMNERYSYIRILRATLSDHEMIFLFYECRDQSNPKKALEEYSFFNKLKLDLLAIAGHKCYYNESAYNPELKGYYKSNYMNE